jgi:predicted RecA/RadA family phage recombinase
MRPEIQKSFLAGTFILAMGVVLFGSTLALATEPVVRAVRGEVIAVTVSESPQVIVVKTMTAAKKEMVVGATVESGAAVTRGKVRITLADIKVGETVELKYIKNTDGLVAKSVHAR